MGHHHLLWAITIDITIIITGFYTSVHVDTGPYSSLWKRNIINVNIYDSKYNIINVHIYDSKYIRVYHLSYIVIPSSLLEGRQEVKHKLTFPPATEPEEPACRDARTG